MRVFRLAPAAGIATVSQREFADLPGMYAPGQRLVDRRKPVLPWRVSINRLGFRGAELTRAKPPGEIRILMLGDSFTFGDFVDDEHTLPAQLEARLQKAGVSARVVNAGLAAATITEEVEMAKRVLSLSPDLVILQFGENDVTELSQHPTVWEQLAANRRSKSRLPLSIAYPILRRTAVWHLFLLTRARARARTLQNTWTSTMGEAGASLNEALRARYRDGLQGFASLLRSANIPLVFVVCPGHRSLDPTKEEQVSWAVGTARDLGISTVNIALGFRASGLPATTLYLLPHDGHPSPRGHAVAAEYLAAELRGTHAWSALRPQPSRSEAGISGRD